MRPQILHVLFLCSLLVLVAAWSKEDHEIFRLRDEVQASEGEDVTFYDFLGVKPSATIDDINKAFRKKSRSLHPDKVKHSFVASKSTPSPKKPGEKRKPAVHVSKGPSQREIQKVAKQANDRYSRLGVVANVLKSPQRERYDHFLAYGFPKWRGTGYYYTRYRPGLGTVLIGLFLAGGGGVHYFILTASYKRQREFMERYIKHARKTAWGDDSGLTGIAGLGAPVAVSTPEPEEPDQMANLNRRQKREMEKQNKKDAKSGKNKSKAASGTSTPQPVATAPTGEKRRVAADNGKVFIVDSVGNVFLEEENEYGEKEELLLDLDEIHKPTIRDTALVRFPLWLYRRAFDPFLKSTKPVTSDEVPLAETGVEVAEGGADATGHKDPSSSQELDYELVDSTGIEKAMNGTNGTKKRSKKGRK